MLNWGSFSVVPVIDGLSNTSITGLPPAGIEVGDWMIAFLANNNGTVATPNGTLTPPANWDVIASNFADDGRWTCHSAVAVKQYTGTESFEFGIVAEGGDDILVIQRVIGNIDVGSIISQVTFDGEPGTDVVTPSINTAVDGQYVLSFAAMKTGGEGIGVDTPPPGMTLLFDERTRDFSSSVRVAAAYEVQAVAGATGAKTWADFSDIGYRFSGTTIALTEIAVGDVAGVNPTGTDTILETGTSSNIAFENLTSNPVSVAVVYDDGVSAPISVQQSDFVLGTVTDGSASATFTDTIGNLPYTDTAYPAANYSYLVTCADDSTFSLDTLTFNPASGRSVVTAINPVNDETSILTEWNSGVAVTDDQIDYPLSVANGVNGITVEVLPDFTHNYEKHPDDEWPDQITYTIGYWDSVTQTRYSVEVVTVFSSIETVNGGSIIVANEQFTISVNGINGNDCSFIHLSSGIFNWTVPIDSVTDNTLITCTAPLNLPTGLDLTLKLYESRSKKQLRLLIDRITALENAPIT